MYITGKKKSLINEKPVPFRMVKNAGHRSKCMFPNYIDYTTDLRSTNNIKSTTLMFTTIINTTTP